MTVRWSKLIILSTIIGSIISISHGLKILVYCPTISKSHVISSGRIADALAAVGHDVILYLPEYDRSVTSFNFTRIAKEIRLNDIGDDFERSTADFLDSAFGVGYASLSVRFEFEDMLTTMCEKLISKKSRELDELRDYGFDISMSEQIDLCGIGVLHHIGIRTHIWLSTTPIMDAVSYNLGIPSPVSYVPVIEENDLSDQMNYWERVTNLYMYISSIIVHRYATDRTTDMFRRHLNDPHFPNLRNLAGESALCFVNSDEFVDFARPILHKTVYIGGLGITQPQPLEPKFEELMNKGANGTVIVSFGSLVRSSSIPPEIAQHFMDAFRQFPDYHFLFKVDSDTIAAEIAPNVDLISWLPQSDMLAHRNVRAFITHGGINGMIEAAYRAVPLITIPIFADQFRNARAAERRGFGYRLDKTRLTRNAIVDALNAVLTTRSYADNARRIANLIRDKPQSPERRLIEWTEFVGKYGSLPELTVTGQYLNTIQYFCLDIFVPFAAIAILIVYVIIRLLFAIVRWPLYRLRKLKKE